MSGDLGTSGPLAPSPVGWGCNAEAGHVNSAQACPSLPDPQDIQKPFDPGVKALDLKLPEKPTPCTGHSLREGVAPFEVLLPNWGKRRPRKLKGLRGKALRIGVGLG